MTQDFKELFAQHAAGVAVLTLRRDDELIGATATSVVSVSAEPAVAAFSLTQGSRFHGACQVGQRVTLNFLGGADKAVAIDFARREPDKFERTGWHETAGGSIVLNPVKRWASGEIIALHDLGTSTLVALELDEIVAANNIQDSRALAYHNRKFSSIG